MTIKAFTLVELLVTITIVAILASISIAVHDEFKDSVRDVEAKTLLRDLNTAYYARLIDFPDHKDLYDYLNSNYGNYVTTYNNGSWSSPEIKSYIWPNINIKDPNNELFIQFAIGTFVPSPGDSGFSPFIIVANCKAEKAWWNGFLRKDQESAVMKYNFYTGLCPNPFYS